MTMDFMMIQKRLKQGLPIYQYNKDEIKYIGSPIGQQIYKRAVLETNMKKNRAMPNDIIDCPICGKKIKRHNQSHHKKTKVCQVYAKINTKLRDLLIDK